MKVLRRDGIQQKHEQRLCQFPYIRQFATLSSAVLGGSRKVSAVTVCCTFVRRNCPPSRGLYIPADLCMMRRLASKKLNEKLSLVESWAPMMATGERSNCCVVSWFLDGITSRAQISALLNVCSSMRRASAMCPCSMKGALYHCSLRFAACDSNQGKGNDNLDCARAQQAEQQIASSRSAQDIGQGR